MSMDRGTRVRSPDDQIIQSPGPVSLPGAKSNGHSCCGVLGGAALQAAGRPFDSSM